jgi:hypothetical protein
VLLAAQPKLGTLVQVVKRVLAQHLLDNAGLLAGEAQPAPSR